MSRRTACVLWALALVTLVVFPLVPSLALRDLVQTAVTATALTVAWRHLLARRDLLRLGWGTLVTAVTVLGCSDALGGLELYVLHYQGHPRPSNLMALFGYALLGVGVVQFERTRNKGRRLPGRMEASIFAFGASTPLLVFLILPVVRADGFTIASRATTVAYALADLAVMTVITARSASA